MTKSIVLSSITIAVIVSFTIFNSIYVSNKIMKIEDLISGTEISKETVDKIFDMYADMESYLSLTVNDNLTNEIEKDMSELRISIENNSQNEMQVSKNRLLCDLRQLRRFCSFGIKSIF